MPTIKNDLGEFVARAVTTAERRSLQAHLSAVWTSDAHGPVQNPANLARLCELAGKMLEPDSMAALEQLGIPEQNAALILIAAELVKGVSGKGSGA